MLKETGFGWADLAFVLVAIGQFPGQCGSDNIQTQIHLQTKAVKIIQSRIDSDNSPLEANPSTEDQLCLDLILTREEKPWGLFTVQQLTQYLIFSFFLYVSRHYLIIIGIMLNDMAEK